MILLYFRLIIDLLIENYINKFDFEIKKTKMYLK